MACDRDTIVAQAKTSGIWCETNKINLLRLIAQLTCEAAENASGGSSGILACGDYGGNPPAFIPFGGCGVARDSVTGQVWWYSGGAWS